MKYSRSTLITLLVLLLLVTMLATPVYAASISVYGLPSSVTVDNTNSSKYTSTTEGGWTPLDGSNTISGSATGGYYNIYLTKITTTAVYTLTFSFSQAGDFSFDWELINANGGKLTVAGTEYSSNTTSKFNKTVASGDTVVVKITSKDGGGPTTANLTNVAFVPHIAVDVTFNPVENFSYSVLGTTINSSTGPQTVTIPAADKTFSVTPDYTNVGNNMKIREWRDGDNGAYSYSETVVNKPTTAITLTPIIADKGIPVFRVKGSTLNYYDWNVAFAAAGTSGTVVVARDGILPAGDYEVPSGQTLLVPCDDANEVYTTQPGDDGADMYVETSVYRTLTMAENAKITVNGAISIGGKIGTNMTGEVIDTKYYYTNGAPSGPLGYIAMNSGSNITVNDGGNLYAWGFITGSGDVTVKSGGAVYEHLQIRDWRGGNCTSSVVEGKDTYEVFPFSQYYIQNVEAPLTIEAGATQTVCTALSVTGLGAIKQNAVFLGADSGLIRLSSGSLTRTYDGSTDRIIYDLNGKISFSNLSISVRVSTLSSVTINSEDYMMPLNSNMTLKVSSGSDVTVGQDFALLPGAILEIENGATVTMGSGKRLIAYDSAQWGAYCSASNYKLNPVYFAPGRTDTRSADSLVDAKIIVDGTLDATSGYLYTTSGGANITSNGSGVVKTTAGTQTVTYQITQSDKDPNYHEITITPAQLLNSNSKYTTTTGASSTTYKYINGFWHKGGVCTGGTATCSKKAVCSICGEEYGNLADHSYTSEVTAPTCTEKGYTTHTCACGYSYTDSGTDATGHTDNDNNHICDVCGFVTDCTDADSDYACDICGKYFCILYAYEACYDAEVVFRYGLKLPQALLNTESAYVRLTKVDGLDGTESVTRYTMAELSAAGVDDNGNYVVSAGVASGEMYRKVKLEIFQDDDTKLQVYKADYSTYESDPAFCVMHYGASTYTNGTDAQKAMVDALLTYGAYAQAKFGVDTENPVDSLLDTYSRTKPNLNAVTTETLTQTSQYDQNEIGIKIKSTEPNLDSRIYLRLAYATDENFSLDNYTFQLKYRDGDEYKTREMTTSGDQPEIVYNADNHVCYAMIYDIPAAYLDNMYTVTITNKKTSEIHTVSTSVVCWARQVLIYSTDEATQNLAKALYLYNQAAKTFFEIKEIS